MLQHFYSLHGLPHPALLLRIASFAELLRQIIQPVILLKALKLNIVVQLC